MSEPDGGGPDTGSLRERKKLATSRALRRMAFDLVAERGFAHVTVDDIAEAAGVSARTFFNYFPTKEAALFGAGHDRVAALRCAIATGLPGEPALAALRAALVADAEALAEGLRDLGGDSADLLRRIKAARQDPHLVAAQAAQMAMTERAMTEALAERLGVSPDADPYPGLLAATGAGAFRASAMFWAASGMAAPLGQLIDKALRALANGLPEPRGLQAGTGSPGKKGNPS